MDFSTRINFYGWDVYWKLAKVKQNIVILPIIISFAPPRPAQGPEITPSELLKTMKLGHTKVENYISDSKKCKIVCSKNKMIRLESLFKR